LLSVPYALKAADAQTLGGLPASAFVLAGSQLVNSQSATTVVSSTTSGSSPVGGTGTQNYIPIWTDNTGDLGNSILYQSGSGSTAKIGINEKSPLFTLDVNGQELVRGLMEMGTTNYANPTKGYNSNPFNLESSAYNSGTKKYTLNHFQWQAEPVGNNTTTPGATLNLLYGTDPTSPAETGLKLSSTGLFTFASGQTFPGTGTITGVTTSAGSGLTGGGTSGTLNLGLTNTCSANQILQWNGTAWICATAGSGGGTITGVTAGTDLTGGGTSGSVTLNVDTTKVPQLATANTFTGNQTVSGNLSATGMVSSSSYQIGSKLFAFGSYKNQNAFLGFAGSSATAGADNTAVGFQAMLANTQGSQNTATGTQALFFNATGSNNTASGSVALYANTQGSYNTASGNYALFSNTAGNSNTAVGAFALTDSSTGNYNTATGHGALATNMTASANTADGYQALYSNTTGTENTASGYQALYSNSTASNNTASGYQALFGNTTGIENAAFGYQALYNNTVGYRNTAYGYQALFLNTGSNTGGDYNTASGYQALYSNTNGFNNVANGVQVLYYNTTGADNTGVGTFALATNTTGGNDTAQGATALQNNTTGNNNTASGTSALEANQTGYDNTAVGAGALNYNVTGNNLTCVGFDCDAGADGLSNATAIGAHAMVGASNSLVLGGTGDYAVKVGIGTSTPSNVFTIARGAGHPVSDSWETYSSRRWKTNIQTLPDALATVKQLRGVSYDRKDTGKHEIGVIAEEVGKVLPELVSYEKNGQDASGVDYSRLTAVLIEAVKQQQAGIARALRQIRSQQVQIKSQQTLLRRQGLSIRALETKLGTNYAREEKNRRSSDRAFMVAIK
jgi:trimeric autotransporter adhesin